MTTKRMLVGVAGLFVVALAVVIGKRMSTDAMAVAIGVVFGVAASIPTSLLIVAVSRRAQEREADQMRSLREQQRVAPPVIVVNPTRRAGDAVVLALPDAGDAQHGGWPGGAALPRGGR
jgi:hypothetical protein